MSNDAQDLQSLIDQITKSQADTKASLDAANISLDAIKTGIATIVKGIPSGGLTADEVANLKVSIMNAVSSEQANADEAAGTASAASEDASLVASSQPPTTTP